MRRAPAIALAGLAALALAALIAAGLGLGELAAPSPDPSPASATGPERPIPLDVPGPPPATVSSPATEPKADAPEPASQAQAGPEAAPELAGRTGLRGRVVDAAGAPIPGAVIWPEEPELAFSLDCGLGGDDDLASYGYEHPTARCDGEGRFVFELAPGRRRVLAVARDHLGDISAAAEVREGALSELPDIVLEAIPTGRLRVQLFGPSGAPYVGEVEVSSERAIVAGAEVWRQETWTTSAEGIAEPRAWPAASYTIHLETPLGDLRGIQVEVQAEAVTPLTLRIPKTPSLTLRILDLETEAPVPNLSLAWQDPVSERELEGRTDARGEVLLHGLSLGLWKVEVWSPIEGLSEGGGEVRRSFDWTLTAADFGGTRELRAHPAADLAVTVLSAAGAPAPEVEVVLDAGDCDSPRGRTDAQGHLTLPCPRGALQSLRATHETLGWARLEATGGFEGAVELRLTAPERLRGRVLCEGEPVAGARVEAAEARARSDAEGRFELILPEPTEQLTVKRRGFRDAQVNLLEPRPETFEVELTRGGSLVGRIVDREIEGHWIVYAWPKEGEGEGGSALTDREGRFEFSGLTDATHELEAFSRRGERRTLPAEARPGQEVELRAEPIVHLRGRLRDPDGAPIPHSWFIVRGCDEGAFVTLLQTDAEGGFSVGLPTTQRAIWIRRSGYASLKVELPALQRGDAVERDLRFPRGAWLQGRLLDSDGSPLSAGIIVRSEVEGLRPQYVHARADGRFEVKGLDSGTWRISVGASEDDEALGREVEVKAGERLDIGDLQLPAAE